MPIFLQRTFLIVAWGTLFRTAIATVKCPTSIRNGQLTSCTGNVGDVCRFTCSTGYTLASAVNSVTCGSDGSWTPENTCVMQCPAAVDRGVVTSCSRLPGRACNFTCDAGFRPTEDVTSIICGSDGQWIRKDVCVEVLCPITIPNGIVSVNACDRRVYSQCAFTCNQGFDPNPKHNRVSCDTDGNWFETAEPFCLERNGLCINFFEHGKWAEGCQFRENETCAFECKHGFSKLLNFARNITCTSSAEWDIDLSLLCKENNRGLIVTLIPKFGVVNNHIYTVPTIQDGTPSLNSIQSHRFPTNVQFYSVDADYTLRHAYVYDHYTKAIYRDSNFSIGISEDDKWTSLHRGLSQDYVKLAVDWISHNMYWTDPQYKWIAVQSLLGNDTSMYRVLIHDNLEGPHGLAVDPLEALLFWSDIGTFTKIEVSSLSGRNRKSLISSNLLKPYSLAADHMSRQLFWLDAGRSTVETATYEGRYRKILLRKTYKSFFDIAVYKDYLYVTDIYDDKLHFFNKTNGEKLHKSLSRKGETYHGITVFHPDAQPTYATVHCLNYGCEQICVTEKDGAICLCKDGYTLNKDMKTCSVNNEYFHRGLMFSNTSSICIVDIRVVTHFSYDPKCVLKTNGTKYMILDTDQRQIIIANDTGIYWARVDNPELHLLTEQSGTISGLAWDGFDRQVYWSERDMGKIWRLSIKTYTAEIFLEGLNTPRDILILQHERRLYWISDRNGSTIESCNFDGSNHKVILNSVDLVDPKSLTYDPYEKRIYFLDITAVGINYVYSCKLDGSDLNYFLSTDRTLEKMEIYRGHLLVTAKDADGTLIISYSIDTESSTTSGVFLDTGNISTLKVFDENVRQNETGPCFNLHDECEHICISNGKTRICECTFGFKLGQNGRNCTSDTIEDTFMLVGDRTHNKIYQISLTDQSVQGINAIGTNSLTGVSYSPVHNLIIWGTEEPEVSIIHLNSTREKMFPISIAQDSLYYPNRLAVDYSTGNIYYTAVNKVKNLVRRHNFIGVLSTNGKHKVLVTGLSYPHGLVVYPSKGLLFYSDSGFRAHLGQSNMDGSEPVVLLDIRMEWPTELIIDYKSDYLYWIDHFDDSIRYCKLDGTDHNKLVEYPGTNLRGLALYQDYLYIAAGQHSNMRKVNIFNPNDTLEFATHGELGRIQSINIYSSTSQNKNALCSMENGGCSTFCFPTPGGGICDCEDDVDLMEGSDKLCSNIPQCPKILSQIIVSTDCQRVSGSKCTFTCVQGYVARQDIDRVLCNGEMYTPADACEAITCPEQFSQGKISSTCENGVGKRCDYECTGYGYQKNDNISTIECTESGTWNRDTRILCQLHPAVSSVPQREANPVAVGVVISVAVILSIIISLFIVFFIRRRRSRNSDFAPNRLEEDVTSGPDMVINTSNGPEVNKACTQVTYEKGAVHINGHT